MDITFALTGAGSLAAGLSWYARDPTGYLRMASRLVASLPDKVILIDPVHRTILMANPRARELLCPTVRAMRHVRLDDCIEGLPESFCDDLGVDGVPRSADCRIKMEAGESREVRIEWWKITSFWRELIVIRIRTDLEEDAGSAPGGGKAAGAGKADHNPLIWLSQARARHELQCRIEECGKRAGRLAVMYVNVDNLKLINDACGYEAGDALLRQIARRLREAVPGRNPVVGMGADEFIAVCDYDSREDAQRQAAGIVAALRIPIRAKDRRFVVTASVGASVYPDDGCDAESLLRHAHIALHHAKGHGRDEHRFFESAMREALDERIQMEHALRGAVRRGELRLVYQPIVEMRSSGVIALEALLRWNHPELGEISPAKFIPVAEGCGLISENIGAWVIRAVCEQLQQWRAEGRSLVPVNINVSPRQIMRGGFADLAQRIVSDAGVDPRLLCFEITETVLMEGLESNLRELNKLKTLGCRVVVDDFGTGYSSLAYLKDLPIDGLKIDKSFVRDMCADPNDAAIVDAVVGLAERLGLCTVAEGVETAEQASRLLVQGCLYAQGYFYGRPQNARDAASSLGLIAEGRSSHRDSMVSAQERFALCGLGGLAIAHTPPCDAAAT